MEDSSEVGHEDVEFSREEGHEGEDDDEADAEHDSSDGEKEGSADGKGSLSSKNFQRVIEDFECEHCGHLEEGNGYTNHCTSCLWSKHVDINPGDRAAECQGLGIAPLSMVDCTLTLTLTLAMEECVLTLTLAT
jgi:hypothetical protein